MDLLSQIPSALGLFGTGLSQHARLITLASAQDSGLPESLMAEHFSGREGVNELYAFVVDALSVSTDRLGLTAMRCAGLLARLGTHGVDVDRSGAGRIAEVYPGASLRLWGFDTQGYRTSTEARKILLAALRSEAAWFEPGDFEKSMIESCDAFDAVIASLAARAAALGRYQQPREDQLAQAATEGWIALPQGPLNSLHSAT